MTSAGGVAHDKNIVCITAKSCTVFLYPTHDARDIFCTRWPGMLRRQSIIDSYANHAIACQKRYDISRYAFIPANKPSAVDHKDYGHSLFGGMLRLVDIQNLALVGTIGLIERNLYSEQRSLING